MIQGTWVDDPVLVKTVPKKNREAIEYINHLGRRGDVKTYNKSNSLFVNAVTQMMKVNYLKSMGEN
ncbi:hypothetical protein ACQKM1_15620 [Peribacillus frigoritolerans]|uniref:hypothetical protein n=1 Tax=Peribacillus frigoritolerans TaxID=450367 RepID=UPI003CFEF318